jgi:hypothetical protein
MAAEQSKPKGPDLARGVPLGDVADGGMVGGHVGDDAVLLARRGDELFAIGSTCSHYGGPLAEGLIVGGPARQSQRPHSTRCRAGAWKSAMARSSCAKKSSLPTSAQPARLEVRAQSLNAW